MKILVVGAGMYVTGRNNSGIGTVLASLCESSKNIEIEEIVVVARNPTNEKEVSAASKRINDKLKTKTIIRFECIGGESLESDLKNLINREHFNVGIVSLPDHLHFEAAKALLESNVHTLVVKPLTPTLAEAKELERIREERNLLGYVEFHKRWDETNLYVKRELDNELLGDLKFFQVEYSQRISIPLDTFKAWADKTNIFQYLGVHYVDLIHFLTGAIPMAVSAIGNRGHLDSKGIHTYDSVHGQVQWSSGKTLMPVVDFSSALNISWIDPINSSAMSDQKYKVIGTKGRIEIDQKNRGIELVHEKEGIQAVNPYFSDYLPNMDGGFTFGGYGHKSIHQFIADCDDVLMSRKAPNDMENGLLPTFKSSMASIKIVEAVNESLQSDGKLIRI